MVHIKRLSRPSLEALYRDACHDRDDNAARLVRLQAAHDQLVELWLDSPWRPTMEVDHVDPEMPPVNRLGRRSLLLP